MDNHIFRNALNGFNRQDVTAYIEKTQKESAERIAQMEQEIEDLRREKAEVEKALESSVQEREALAERFEEQLRAARAECDGLLLRVSDMEGKVEVARCEKESVAQLELEARKRAEAIVETAERLAEELTAQAREQAQARIAESDEQAQRTLDNAHARAEEIRSDMEEQVTKTVREYNDLFMSFETAASHIAGELHKMDVMVSQLPINFNHLKDGLETVRAMTVDQTVTEK